MNQYRSLGPIFRVRAFGRRFVVLAGPEANLLLARGNVHFRTFEVWQRFDADVGALRQIMSMGGGDHAKLRKHQAPVYSTGLLKSRMAEVVDLVRGEVASWPENGPVAGQYMFQRLFAGTAGPPGDRPLSEAVPGRPHYLSGGAAAHESPREPSRLLLGLPHVRRARRRVMELAGRILADHDPARRAGLPPDYIDDVLALHRADPEQVRQAFYGDEAQRIQRGRDDVRVMVRYPRDERRSLGNLENMRIRTPDGARYASCLARQPVLPALLRQALDELGVSGDVEDVARHVAADAA